MSPKSLTSRKKPYAATLLLGLVSLTLYSLLLLNQDVVNTYFGLGGFYAFLPIATAFLFSFIHGNFTGNFWTVLGVEASKRKKEVK
jgi:F0F1-type ATP synthase assembly protein I